ncbi:LOW QUALITY PROTEIN: hypothetical protein U9M48_032700 [Paspalum notatum var. saurae]|uniref:F-box domain-containing protein n=1 Tax=Paspalum notatum var. saurae TaxID=547442 RepID=A0AAQ3U9U0_PASNO
MPLRPRAVALQPPCALGPPPSPSPRAVPPHPQARVAAVAEPALHPAVPAGQGRRRRRARAPPCRACAPGPPPSPRPSARRRWPSASPLRQPRPSTTRSKLHLPRRIAHIVSPQPVRPHGGGIHGGLRPGRGGSLGVGAMADSGCTLAACDSVGGARSRPRRRLEISATYSIGESMKSCIGVEEGRPLGETGRKRKQKTTTPAPKPNTTAPELFDEIILDILVRLPVKSLLRFKSVCKAWHAIISDPIFIRTHIQCSTSKQKHDPSFLINPHTLYRVIPGEFWPTTFSNRLRFYQWQQGDSRVTLVHEKDFDGEFSVVFYFAHCDGLVLVPTDTMLYLFNPATRDSITLPNSNNDNLQHGIYHSAAGLGLDPRTGKYKIVRSFYPPWDPHTSIDCMGMGMGMGMETFTIGDSSGGWREILSDPPYLVERWQTALTVNGFMFWHMDKDHHEQPPRGLLCLSLGDETFDVIGLPDSLDPALDATFMLDVLDGELWLSAHTSEMPSPGTMTIWVKCMEGGVDSRWEQRYSIYVSDVCHPMGFLPNGGIGLWKGFTLYNYDLSNSELMTECKMDRLRYQGQRARTWKNLFRFNVKPYTESLVPITL